MSVDRDTLNAVITQSVADTHKTPPATPFLAHIGIVETLRAAFADIDKIRQYGLLLQLLTVAKADGFSRESFTTALNYLREGQKYSIPPSEWGLKALMENEVRE